MMYVRIVAALVCLWFLGGTGAFAQNGPQSLPTNPLSIQTQSGDVYDFTVEIADDLNEQRIGMMFRTKVPDDEGMLFIYNYPQPLSFWMKNVPVALDILFVQSDGRIANIAAQAKPHSIASIPSKGRVLAVVELRGGLAKELGIRAGDTVLHPIFNTVAKADEK